MIKEWQRLKHKWPKRSFVFKFSGFVPLKNFKRSNWSFFCYVSILVNFSNFFHANLTELELNRKGTKLGNFIKGPIHFLKKEKKN